MVKSKKKLVLATQTVSLLSTDTLQTVQGGNIRPRKGQSQCTYDESGCIVNG